MSTDGASVGGRLGRRPLGVPLGVGAASFLDSSAIVGIGLGLALWRDAFDLTPGLVGLVGSAVGFAIGLGALLGGRAADAWGWHRTYRSSMVLYAASAAVVACAPDATWLVGAALGLGLASGADLPPSLSIVSAIAPSATRGRLVAGTHVWWILGVVTTTAVGVLVSDLGLTGIRLLFAGLAVLAGLVAVTRVVVPPPPLDDDGLPRARLRAAGPGLRRDLVLLAAFFVCVTVVTNTFGTYRTYLTIVTTGASQREATALALLMTLVVLTGSTVLARRAADLDARRRLFVLGSALVVTSQVLIALGATASLLWLSLVLVLFSLGTPFASDGIYKIWTQERFPSELRASAQGTTYAAGRVVAAAFALLTPHLLERHVAALFSALALLGLSATVLGLLITRREPAPSR